MTEKILDLRGEICPGPLMITGKALETMETGDRVKVMIDSIQTVRNILRWCEQREFEVEVDDNGALWIITIVR